MQNETNPWSIFLVNTTYWHNFDLGKCHFLPGEGVPENWGIRYFFVDQKGGSKDFFKLKRRDHLYFLKNILLNISEHKWNSS